MPACLSYAMLEFALEQEPEECARMLGRPLRPSPTVPVASTTPSSAGLGPEASLRLPDPTQP